MHLLSKRFFKTCESAIVTWRGFHAHVMLRRNDAVPGRKSILLWVVKISGSQVQHLRESNLKALKFPGDRKL